MATNGILAEYAVPEFNAGAVPAQQATAYKPEGDALASNQIDKLLSKDSPYLQQARTRALQVSNARGLTNSSLAVTAGESAAYDAAMPIAQADANSNFTAQRDNNNNVNQFAQSANQFGREGYLAQYRAGVDFNTQARDQQFNAGQNDLNRAQQFGLQRDSQSFQAGQSVLDRAQQTSLQTGQQQFSAGQNALDRQQQFTLLSAQQGFQAAQANLDRAQQVALADKSTEAQQALQAAQQQFSAAQSTLDRAQQAGLQVNSQNFQADQNAQQRTFQTAQDTASFNRDMAKMNESFKLNQSTVPIQYANSIATSTSAAVQAIIANPEISAVKDPATGLSPKDIAIQNQVNYSNTMLSWGEKFYGGTINPIQMGAQTGIAAPPPYVSPPMYAPAPPTAEQIQQAVADELTRRAAEQSASYEYYNGHL